VDRRKYQTTRSGEQPVDVVLSLFISDLTAPRRSRIFPIFKRLNNGNLFFHFRGLFFTLCEVPVGLRLMACCSSSSRRAICWVLRSIF